MIDLVSPEYSFEDFCSSMFGMDPMEVMHAASAEIVYARSKHREATKGLSEYTVTSQIAGRHAAGLRSPG
jgi:hypothetical protein